MTAAKIRALTLSVLGLLAASAPARAADFTVTVATTGPTDAGPALVISSPTGISCPPTCTAPFTGGSTITLYAIQPSTLAFVAWGTPCRSNTSCSVPVLVASTVTATFAPILNLNMSGTGIGTVTINGYAPFRTSRNGGGTASYVVPMSSTIVLNASTGTGSAFTGWTASAGSCATASTCTLTMSSYTVVTATFNATGTVGVSSYTIQVVVPNAGGIVYSSPAGLVCGSTHTTCTAAFVSGGAISFSTQALTGYRFGGWANAGCRGASPCVINSTSPLQGLGGKWSPAAYFYPTP